MFWLALLVLSTAITFVKIGALSVTVKLLSLTSGIALVLILAAGVLVLWRWLRLRGSAMR